MVFTKSAESIRSKVNIYMDGGWISMMVIEEVTMKTESEEHSFGEDSSSSEFEERSFSSEQCRRGEEFVEFKGSSGGTEPQEVVDGEGDILRISVSGRKVQTCLKR